MDKYNELEQLLEERRRLLDQLDEVERKINNWKKSGSNNLSMSSKFKNDWKRRGSNNSSMSSKFKKVTSSSSCGFGQNEGGSLACGTSGSSKSRRNTSSCGFGGNGGGSLSCGASRC